jgi:hypothetical protein
VGILVSGGIAPGINAVIAGIVERQTMYAQQGHYRLNIHAYQNGLNAIYHEGTENYTTLTPMADGIRDGAVATRDSRSQAYSALWGLLQVSLCQHRSAHGFPLTHRVYCHPSSHSID